MTKTIAFLLISALLLASTPATAQSWWWSKKTTEEQTNQKPTLFNKQSNSPKTQKKPVARSNNLDRIIRDYKSSMVSFDKLDSIVARTRSADLKNARSYAQKQQAKIARNERARKLARARQEEKENAANLPPQQTTKKKRKYQVYNPPTKKTNGRKPPRVFNTID